MTWLRDAPWLTAQRLRLYGLAYVAFALAMLGVSIAAGLAGGIGIGPVAPAILLALVLRRHCLPAGR